MRFTCRASMVGWLSSPAAAARRSSSSGIDDHRKKLIRLAISQPLSGFSAPRATRFHAIEEGRRHQDAGEQRAERVVVIELFTVRDFS